MNTDWRRRLVSRTRARRRRAPAVLFGLTALLLSAGVPEPSRACPGCIDSNKAARRILPVVMSFLVVPFGVVGVATVAIRRRLKAEAETPDERQPEAVGESFIVYSEPGEDVSPERGE